MLVAAVAIGFFIHSRRAHAMTEKDSILVADFVNTTGDAMFDGTLRKALAVDLEQSPFLNVVPDQKVRQTLTFMGRAPEERVTNEIGREICQRDGIKAMLSGSIAAIGSQYLVTLTAINAANGDTLAEAQQQADNKDHVLAAMGEAVSALRGRLGESLASVKKFDKPLQEATTSSLDALKAYTLGDQLHMNGDDPGSLPFYHRAIELDPNFALAYARLATAYGNLSEETKSEQYRKRAFELRDRASERERLYIESHYYTDNGQSEKGLASYQMYAQTYPRDYIPVSNLGVEYGSLGQWEKSLEFARRAIELDPDGFYSYAAAARAYQAMGRVDEAKAVLNAALQRNLGRANLHTAMAKVAEAQGDKATQQREETVARKDPGEERWLTWRDGVRAAQQGQMKRARELYRQASEMAERAGLKATAALWVADQAYTEAEFDLRGQAAQDAAAALALSHSSNVTELAAAAFAAAGQEKQALALMADLRKQRPDNEWIQAVWAPAVNSLVGINHKEGNKAVELLKPAFAYGVSFDTVTIPYTRGQAYLLAGQPQEAVQEFQRILALHLLLFDAPEMALARLGLARAYVAMGDKAKARTAYQDVLAMWKDADPGVPLIEQARAEYAKLQ